MTITAAPEPDWELDQLAALAAAALAAASVAQPNGQVQAAPDRRTIRWYQSLGIVDPPRRVGRSARYGPRQLAQVVAMKRLQASGVSVEEAGRRMAGLDEAALQQLAALPEGLALSDPAPARPFWRQD
ncbi:MAG: MerR family transcriptional regulator, partial [Acidimicrobiales bacterium]